MRNLRYERTGNFDVTLHAYCGMNVPVAEDVDKDAAKDAVRGFLRRARRKGNPVEKLGPRRWEIQTPEDAIMVDDLEGTLAIHPRLRRYQTILGRKMYID